jgi:hypothetical protein
MARIVRGSVFFLGLIGAATVCAATNSIKVCVSDEGGKVAFKGVVQAGTPFVTETLKAGDYVVQFTSSPAALKDHQYLLVVSAGDKKVVADSVPTEKFAGGGVAMRVKVGAGLKIIGQVERVSASVSNRVIERGKIRTIQDRFGEGVHNHLADRPYLRSY